MFEYTISHFMLYNVSLPNVHQKRWQVYGAINRLVARDAETLSLLKATNGVHSSIRLECMR